MLQILYSDSQNMPVRYNLALHRASATALQMATPVPEIIYQNDSNPLPDILRALLS
jgi:hypothetical protein